MRVTKISINFSIFNIIYNSKVTKYRSTNGSFVFIFYTYNITSIKLTFIFSLFFFNWNNSSIIFTSFRNFFNYILSLFIFNRYNLWSTLYNLWSTLYNLWSINFYFFNSRLIVWNRSFLTFIKIPDTCCWYFMIMIINFLF